jgi:hypothetical protein
VTGRTYIRNSATKEPVDLRHREALLGGTELNFPSTGRVHSKPGFWHRISQDIVPPSWFELPRHVLGAAVKSHTQSMVRKCALRTNTDTNFEAFKRTHTSQMKSQRAPPPSPLAQANSQEQAPPPPNIKLALWISMQVPRKAGPPVANPSARRGPEARQMLAAGALGLGFWGCPEARPLLEAGA